MDDIFLSDLTLFLALPGFCSDFKNNLFCNIDYTKKRNFIIKIKIKVSRTDYQYSLLDSFKDVSFKQLSPKRDSEVF